MRKTRSRKTGTVLAESKLDACQNHYQKLNFCNDLLAHKFDASLFNFENSGLFVD